MTYEEVIEQVLQSGVYNEMTKSDAYFAFAYTTGYYYDVTNQWLLRGLNPELRVPIVEAAINSISKLPKFPPNTTFYRAIELRGSDLEAFLNKYVEGAFISEPHFQSVAPRIEDSFIGLEGKNIEFTIRGRTGSESECRNIHDFAMGKYWNQPENRTLSEGVFLPNTVMEVLEVLPPENGVYRFILKELE